MLNVFNEFIYFHHLLKRFYHFATRFAAPVDDSDVEFVILFRHLANFFNLKTYFYELIKLAFKKEKLSKKIFCDKKIFSTNTFMNRK